MGNKTGIAWTESTWNPVVGCSVYSAGCKRCYAMKMAARLEAMGNQAYQGLTVDGKEGPVWNGTVQINPATLDQPLRWKRRRMIFANSMSDLFHEGLPVDVIATVFAIAVASVHLNGHVIQILTKRAARMRAVLNDPQFWEQVNAEVGAHVMNGTDPLDRRRGDARATLDDYGPGKPPPGIWMGVSVEDQPAADERIPELIATPAAKRFISAEPLLSAIDVPLLHKLDWVIVGAESGKGARYMELQWARDLHVDCIFAGVLFFMKQISGMPGRVLKDMAMFPDDLRVQEMPA